MTIRPRILGALRRLRTSLIAWSSRRVLTHGRDLHIGAGTRIWAPGFVSIGKCAYLGKDVLIECNAAIGDYVLIANRVALVGRHDHDFRAVGIPVRFSPWVGNKKSIGSCATEKVVIQDDVWLGFAAIILSGVTVGRGAIVAAGSVVTGDVAPYSIVAGNPARAVGQRFHDEQTIELHERAIGAGKFAFSERGYEHWIVEPGK